MLRPTVPKHIVFLLIVGLALGKQVDFSSAAGFLSPTKIISRQVSLIEMFCLHAPKMKYELSGATVVLLSVRQKRSTTRTKDKYGCINIIQVQIKTNYNKH